MNYSFERANSTIIGCEINIPTASNELIPVGENRTINNFWYRCKITDEKISFERGRYMPKVQHLNFTSTKHSLVVLYILISLLCRTKLREEQHILPCWRNIQRRHFRVEVFGDGEKSDR